MNKRKQVAVYIDYALRTPNFETTFASLKQYMFEGLREEIEVESEEGIMRDFWRDEVKNPDIEQFYIKQIPTDKVQFKDWKNHFYNNQHYEKFIEDYSFNLFVDAEVPCNKDVTLINIAQKELFDVVLVDEYMSTRKKSNTFFFLSKTRLTPYSVLFLKVGETLNPDDYLGIWNPQTNPDQINGENEGAFQNWLMELESILKKEKQSNEEIK